MITITFQTASQDSSDPTNRRESYQVKTSMTSVAKKTQSLLEGTTDRLKPHACKHAPVKVKVK